MTVVDQAPAWRLLDLQVAAACSPQFHIFSQPSNHFLIQKGNWEFLCRRKNALQSLSPTSISSS
jgi:hypothetical protein